MWQRIQSLFLLLAAACAASTWMFPVRAWARETTSVIFNTYGLFHEDGQELADVSLPLPFHLLQTLVAVVMLITIFLYGNRSRQARVVRGAWLIALLVAVMQFLSCNSIDAYLKSDGGYGASFFLPLGTLLFSILAERAIRKDEALVKSADRLR